MNKKSQAWGFDLIIALTIFLIAIIVFYLYSLNYPKETQETLDLLNYEGDFIAESILSEGYPSDWNESNVVRIGILNNEKINETKIERLYYMANYAANTNGYTKAKSTFNTRFEFFFNISAPIEINGSAIPEGGIGKNFAGQNPNNLIKITRLTIYRNNPATLNLFIWE